jgi:septum formation protein
VKYDLILASASPRRAELLQQIGVRFKVVPSNIDEKQQPGESAVDYVTRMAVEKARKVATSHPEGVPILGADTTVVLGADIFGKPRDYSDARTMLQALSGNSHQVLTAVAVDDGETSSALVSKTEVTFRHIREHEYLSYWQSGEPEDKAGAYAIQGYGAVFVENLRGSYSGVVGLPIAQTYRLLAQFNVPIWSHKPYHQ